MPSSARALIAKLGLRPHPEGGWYRETWRAGGSSGDRPAATGILFLLEAGQRSHWHRVDAEELWFWHGGAPRMLATAASDDAAATVMTLGPDVAAGHHVQARVPAHHWQATEAATDWSLFSCVVSPGFRFEGFTLAPDGWSPGG